MLSSRGRGVFSDDLSFATLRLSHNEDSVQYFIMGVYMTSKFGQLLNLLSCWPDLALNSCFAELSWLLTCLR